MIKCVYRPRENKGVPCHIPVENRGGTKNNVEEEISSKGRAAVSYMFISYMHLCEGLLYMRL